MNLIILIAIIVLIIICLIFAIGSFKDGDSGKGIISVIGIIIGFLTLFLFNSDKPLDSNQTEYNINSQLINEYSRGYQDGLSAGTSNSTGVSENQTSIPNQTSDIAVESSSGIVKLSSLDYFTKSGYWDYTEQVRINTGDYVNDCFVTQFLNNTSNSCYTVVDYIISGQYKKLEGILFLSYEHRSTDLKGIFNIWGDGILIYTSPEITGGLMPTPFEVDISGVTKLKIGFETNNSWYDKCGMYNVLLYKD